MIDIYACFGVFITDSCEEEYNDFPEDSLQNLYEFCHSVPGYTMPEGLCNLFNKNNELVIERVRDSPYVCTGRKVPEFDEVSDTEAKEEEEELTDADMEGMSWTEKNRALAHDLCRMMRARGYAMEKEIPSADVSRRPRAFHRRPLPFSPPATASESGSSESGSSASESGSES
jgi:hypothetical protein